MILAPELLTAPTNLQSVYERMACCLSVLHPHPDRPWQMAALPEPGSGVRFVPVKIRFFCPSPVTKCRLRGNHLVSGRLLWAEKMNCINKLVH